MNVRDLETLSIRSLSIFVTSCQTLNLTQCAELMGLPKSTVSKEITKLEAHFKTKLLERSTRNVYITEPGRIVYQHALQMLDGLHMLQEDVRTMEEQVQGLLYISAPPALGSVLSELIIPGFLKRWPKTSIRLNLSYSFEDLFAGGVDLAIRVGKVHDERLVSRQIGASTRLLAASKSYVQQHGAPQIPEDLSAHNCLRFEFNHTTTKWALVSGENTKLIDVSGNFFCSNIPALRQVTLQGCGIAQLPISAVKEDVVKGDLVRILPDWHLSENPIFAVYRGGINRPKKLQAMLDYLSEHKDVFALTCNCFHNYNSDFQI
ncbi:LysR family transcriptional regulator [Alteromonas sp. a30]|uniref:LysR family transcriptional regulator n=1 Tax=Alteromonas sp. a30 TaxID=2730917 RepID=UPI002280A4A6|nr:LysR family transcriptional regulator [Alteromonas sp. a30]MCY7295512.1 LysR family transcriptional regulator [Alteromonas sp. a30]